MTPQEMALLEQLETEWNQTGDVDVFAFLQKNLGISGTLKEISAERLEFVCEAVQIDMERRACLSGLVRIWSLDDYILRLPILSDTQTSKRLAMFEMQVGNRIQRTVADSPTSERKERDGQNPIQLSENSQFGPYRVVREIGRGGMGAVYEAMHSHLHKRVALKVISKSVLDDAVAASRFRREMKAVGLVDHINVVRAMDAGEIEGTLYLVTEFIAGVDLGKLVREKGPQTVAESLHIVRQAASALDAAHTAGIVHRDVKPSNLLLTDFGDVKLLDLGLARVADDHGTDATSTGSIFGTPDYMAPEQWDDVRSVDHRADIYSLGCTLYFLLTGQAPYGGEKYRSPSSKMKAHIDADTPALPESCDDPEGLVFALISKMMAKKPDGRYGSASQIVQVIDNITKPDSGQAPPVLPKIVMREKRHSGETHTKSAPRKTSALSHQAAPSRKSVGTGRWVIPFTFGLVLCGGGFVWWLNSGNTPVSDQTLTVNSGSEANIGAGDKLSHDATAAVELSKGNELPPQTTKGKVGGEDKTGSTPVLTGNAHRRFAQTALQLGRPVEVLVDAYESNALLKELGDLPEQDFMIAGNWDCLDSPAWRDEHMKQLEGLHYLRYLMLRGTQVSDVGVTVFTDQEITTRFLTMSQEHLIAIGGIMQASSLTVTPPESGRMKPWPAFLGSQPQLDNLITRIDDDATLELISQNKQLINLELEFMTSGSSTPSGMLHLAKLPLLSSLRVRGNASVGELVRASKELPRLKSLFVDSPCDVTVVQQLQNDRPDLVIVHPEVTATQEDADAVRSLLGRGAKVVCYPSWNDVAEPRSFQFYGIDWTGLKLDDLETSLLSARGLRQFTWGNMNGVNVDALSKTLSEQVDLSSISLHGSTSNFTGLAIQHFSQLRGLTTLLLSLGDGKSITAQELAPLSECKTLKDLSLVTVSLDDAGLNSIAQCSYLMQLIATLGPTATHVGVAELQNLKWLKTLHLNCGKLTPEMLREIGGISSLRILTLQTPTPLNPDDIATLQSALPKCVIFHSQGISFPEDAR